MKTKPSAKTRFTSSPTKKHAGPNLLPDGWAEGTRTMRMFPPGERAARRTPQNHVS